MEEKKPKLELVEPDVVGKPADADDIEALLLDQELGDGITNVTYHVIPVGKPKSFFRTHPDASYRRQAWIYTHKIEGQIEETNYIIAKEMRGHIDEARPCTLVTVIYRDGSPRLWPIKQPKEGEKDNAAWISARAAAKVGLERWTKLVWVRNSYHTRDALEGYAPDPDWSKLPPFHELLTLAFGDAGIIRDKTHAIYHELFGIKPKQAAVDDE
jgi:hypothetical protein